MPDFDKLSNLTQMGESPVQPIPADRGEFPPHLPIEPYFTSIDQKGRFLSALFNDTAADYDKFERWLSLGTGRWYRRQSLLRAGLCAGMHVADIGVGTGLVAREALAIVGPTGTIVGVDPSSEMLRHARSALAIETVEACAESLPFASGSLDFVSMGYALRHVSDLTIAFREFFRVLKPGGRICILEISRPRTAIGRALLRTHLAMFSRGIGRLTRAAPRTAELWSYYWETIDRCVSPDRVLQAMRAVGFHDAQRTVSLRIFSEYTATRR